VAAFGKVKNWTTRLPFPIAGCLFPLGDAVPSRKPPIALCVAQSTPNGNLNFLGRPNPVQPELIVEGKRWLLSRPK